MVDDAIDGGRIRHLDVRGVRTRYYDEGDGEALLLLHGGQFGQLTSLNDWSLNLAPLARRFRVLALDRLGHGYTDNPRRAEDYTYDAVDAHIRDFIEMMGLERVHVVGHSRSGLLATHLALERPEIVRTLVIVDSNTTAPEDPDHPSEDFYEKLARQPVQDGPPTREGVMAQRRGNAFDPEAFFSAALVDHMVEIARLPKLAEAQRMMAEQGGPRGGGSVWLPSLDRVRAEVLRSIDSAGIQVPTLIVWGANDPSASLAHHGLPLFRRICARSPSAALHVVNRAGHFPFRERWRAFNALIEAFCGSHA